MKQQKSNAVNMSDNETQLFWRSNEVFSETTKSEGHELGSKQ